MFRLVPLLVVLSIFADTSYTAETNIQDALEKARQRAGAPASDAKAKQDQAAREAARKRAQEEQLRLERDEAIRKAREAEKAAAEKKQGDASPPAPSGEKKPVRIFTLKDGTQIEAVMVIELQDTYALKDRDGKLHEVKREDVESIKDAP